MVTYDISKLLAVLEEDAKSLHPKYPSQARFALRDERVKKALAARLGKKQTLKSIKSLPYSFRTGLIFIYFEFSPNGLESIGSDSCLVILTDVCAVVGLVDPFDFEQPNRAVPPLPESEDLEPDSCIPFALSRPSATDSLIFTEEELYPVEIRSRAFFKRLGGLSLGGADAGMFGNFQTTTSLQTQTVRHHNSFIPGYNWKSYDYNADEITDDHVA